MKLLLVLCFSLFTSVVMACTDFTGSYRDGEGHIAQIKQSGCVSLTFTNHEGSGAYITDGQLRVSHEDAEIKVLTSAAFVGAALNIESRLQYKQPMPPEMPTQYIPVRAATVFTKSTSGDVVGVSSVYNSENQVISSQVDSYSKL